MVAAYHSLVGLAAAAASIANIMLAADGAHGALDGVHMTTAFLGDIIGAITLTGSVRAALEAGPGPAPGSGLAGRGRFQFQVAAGLVRSLVFPCVTASCHKLLFPTLRC